MIRLMKRFLTVLLPTIIIASILPGCKKNLTVEEVETRVKVLTDKGVPDSVVSNIKVYIYNLNSARKLNQTGNAKKYNDSMAIGIVAAEKWYETALTEFKPIIESKKKSITDSKSALTGLQLKTADSLMSIVDSFINVNWVVQAKVKIDKLDSLMPGLLEDEKKAKEIRTKILGIWGDAHTEQAEGVSYKSISKKFFKFLKDGKFSGTESMSGQTTDYMKEDWEFQSWGKYDLKGDTILLYVEREKCPRQIFTQLHVKENKWIKDVKPTYDSTITNGAKNRFILFTDLKAEFKKM